MTPTPLAMHELHVVYGTGPVGTAVIETLAAQECE